MNKLTIQEITLLFMYSINVQQHQNTNNPTNINKRNDIVLKCNHYSKCTLDKSYFDFLFFNAVHVIYKETFPFNLNVLLFSI